MYIRFVENVEKEKWEEKSENFKIFWSLAKKSGNFEKKSGKVSEIYKIQQIQCLYLCEYDVLTFTMCRFSG